MSSRKRNKAKKTHLAEPDEDESYSISDAQGVNMGAENQPEVSPQETEQEQVTKDYIRDVVTGSLGQLRQEFQQQFGPVVEMASYWKQAMAQPTETPTETPGADDGLYPEYVSKRELEAREAKLRKEFEARERKMQEDFVQAYRPIAQTQARSEQQRIWDSFARKYPDLATEGDIVGAQWGKIYARLQQQDPARLAVMNDDEMWELTAKAARGEINRIRGTQQPDRGGPTPPRVMSGIASAAGAGQVSDDDEVPEEDEEMEIDEMMIAKRAMKDKLSELRI